MKGICKERCSVGYHLVAESGTEYKVNWLGYYEGPSLISSGFYGGLVKEPPREILTYFCPLEFYQ